MTDLVNVFSLKNKKIKTLCKPHFQLFYLKRVWWSVYTWVHHCRTSTGKKQKRSKIVQQAEKKFPFHCTTGIDCADKTSWSARGAPWSLLSKPRKSDAKKDIRNPNICPAHGWLFFTALDTLLTFRSLLRQNFGRRKHRAKATENDWKFQSRIVLWSCRSGADSLDRKAPT